MARKISRMEAEKRFIRLMGSGAKLRGITIPQFTSKLAEDEELIEKVLGVKRGKKKERIFSPV